MTNEHGQDKPDYAMLSMLCHTSTGIVQTLMHLDSRRCDYQMCSEDEEVRRLDSAIAVLMEELQTTLEIARDQCLYKKN